MDCRDDAIAKKRVVPTHIGTAVHLSYPYEAFTQWQWDIHIGKMQKREE